MDIEKVGTIQDVDNAPQAELPDPRTATAVELLRQSLDALEQRRLEVLARRQTTLNELRFTLVDPDVVRVVKADAAHRQSLEKIDDSAAAGLRDIEKQKKTLDADLARVRKVLSDVSTKRRPTDHR